MTKSDKNLVEYLYVDAARLNRYFEQISSPVTYDKVPIWKTALGLTGPKAEATQARPGRSFTDHEKATRFVKYLEEHDLSVPYRPKNPFEPIQLEMSDDPKPFRFERMTARRCHVPPKDEKVSRGLNIWISPEPDGTQPDDACTSGVLFLIEDFRGDEGMPNCVSGYSSLLQLVGELGSIIENTKLDGVAKQEEAERRFGENPIATLSAIGAQFGTERRISAIYRIRATCNEIDAGCAVTTIGYPILIQEV